MTAPTFDYTPSNKNDNKAAAQTNTVVWTPSSGYRAVIMGIVLATNGANTVSVDDSGSTTIVPSLYLPANGVAVISGGGAPLFEAATNLTIRYTSSAATNVSILVWGYETKQ